MKKVPGTFFETGRWRFWVDTGGTFTDAVAVDPDGRLRRAKVLSSGALRGRIRRVDGARIAYDAAWDVPEGFVRGLRFRLLDRPGELAVEGDDGPGTLRLERPSVDTRAGAPFELLSDEEAPLLAARLIARAPPGSPLPPSSMRLATTRGTNALLERRGARTALVITRGFRDLLRIGTQDRPDLFALAIPEPTPLYDAVFELDERIDAAGRVLREPDGAEVEELARRIVAAGFEAVAVGLMHSYRNPVHERRVREALARAGLYEVSCSAELAPSIRLVPRARTAVIDAYLARAIRTYLDRVTAGLGGGRMLVMTSAGGLMTPESYRPKDSLLSGPAGGVVGAALAGRRAGFEKLLAFDMGGTSTDVARVDGDFEYRFEHRVGDAELLAPSLAIESVAAGGGSVCWFDGERLRVGPQSAGASPGPACYGAGGPLTLTDVNLLSGRLDPARFGLPVQQDAARARLDELRAEVERASGEAVADDRLLEGLRAIADETMADAIRRVSLRRGYDPADYALVAFGGAGGQHACAVAERLGVRRIVLPVDAGLLSALGLGHARLERFASRQVLVPLEACAPRIEGWFDALGREAIEAVRVDAAATDAIEVRRRLAHLRFVGQDATLEIEWAPGESLEDGFFARYEELFGHRPARRAIELESIRVAASVDAPPIPSGPPVEARTLDGPALIAEDHCTIVVDPGWHAERRRDGSLVLTRRGAGERVETEHAEAVRLELFTNRFVDIARGMGERLRHTAVSTNVKERLDFSCALLDAAGELVTNAPHIPVHLGALGLCVRRLAAELDMQPGDVVVTNHPAFGGSHLPDVTVVMPVFDPADARRLLGYVANRAHHAEIGGSRPGSMPPDARRLVEEGVVIPPTRVVRAGVPRYDAIETLLRGGPHPSRAVQDNLADLRAAVAANHAGARALQALAQTHGHERVSHYMRRLTDMAERRIRAALAAFPDGEHRAEERLDDGTPLAVTVRVAGDSAAFDFRGSGGVHDGNLNATPAIVHSAVVYVLRLMLDEPLPLNEGLLRPVSLEIPAGLLNPPFGTDASRAPAVVGGNVETSQRLVDTLIKALGLAACSQGTMNNVIFGNERFGYYETVCGGTGAGPGFDGRSAVHSHMTNTRITDPEVIEQRYPARVERFEVRRGSGGAGRWRGGDGARRELTFLEPLALSVLTQHRTVAPYGREGGSDGAPGRQRVVRAGGDTVELGSVDRCDVRPGDRLILETPGGGGWGAGELG